MSSPNSLAPIVSRIANRLGDEKFPRGELAELRRMSPESPGPAFWKLMAQVQPELLSADNNAPIRRWALVVQSLAALAALPQSDAPLGEALAEAGVSERRFDRLLRADEEQLPDLLRAAIHQLNAGARAGKRIELAELILSTDESKAERVRVRLARDFYRTTHAKSE